MGKNSLPAGVNVQQAKHATGTCTSGPAPVNLEGASIHVPADLESDYTTDHVESFEFARATQTEIFNLVKAINVIKSSGIPDLSASILKLSLKTLNPEFSHVINTSINRSEIPKDWKKATVIPIPKTGDLSKVGNYRPISLLPAPGKILEKLIHNQLVEHIESGSLLSDYQYGFRNCRSTLHAVTYVVNNNINKKIKTVAVFIDFRKAFDCLQFPQLMEKLSQLHLHHNTISWLRNYLTGRTQSTLVNGTRSPEADITQGVPQGSIIGPLLYIIYANDIPNVIKHSKFAFYADDTVLLASHKNMHTAFANIQKDLDNLWSWCESNGIFINTSKTEYMIFRGRKPVSPIALDGRPLSLSIQKNCIDRVSCYSYLGIWLDEQLNFNRHASSIVSRTSYKIHQLRKIRHFINSKAALLVYKNMILPVVEYGDIYLSSVSKESQKKMQTLQNRAIKCALSKEKRFSTKMLHTEAKLELLKVRRKYHMLQHVFKTSQLSGFKGWKRSSIIKTRSSKRRLMALRKPNTNKYKRSITYKGPKMWNALPTDAQTAPNLWQFKSLIRRPGVVPGTGEVPKPNPT